MALFRKQQADDLPAGRRRPVDNTGAPRRGAPGTMFSYYSQRSATQSNLGRRDYAEIAAANAEGSDGGGSPRRYTPLTVLGGIVVFAIVCLLLNLSTQPKVVLLQDQTTDYFLQDADVYARSAQESLDGSIFNHNKLTVDTTMVRADLLKNYPEIKNVSVDLPLIGMRPVVYIEPYKPSFVLTTTSNSAFLLDETGRALANTSQIPDLSKLGVPTLQDKTGGDVTLGSRAVASSTVKFVETVTKALKAKGVRYTTLTLPAGTYELDVALTGQPYYLRFNLMDDALQQTGTYLAVRGRLNSEKLIPAHYIDLRVPERAYYQ